MEITKEQAREILNDTLKWRSLPESDILVYRCVADNSIVEYTFIGLIKYIYDLK